MSESKHIFSETAVWKTESVFITPDGVRHPGEGESHITVYETKVINESWTDNHLKLRNEYRVTHMDGNRYLCRSENVRLGTQYGWMDLHDNTMFSKFEFEDSNYSGYEVITRNGDTAYVVGALYKGNQLENTWTATMRKQ